MRRSISQSTTLFMAALVTLFTLAGCSSNEPTGKAAENLAKGTAFMEKNKLRDSVITLDNGIQYEVVTKGSGKSPRLTDIVIVHSRGKHLDGTTFSDTYKEGKPEEVLVKHTIPGWKKTLPLMSVGSRWKVYLPPNMAFSNRGAEGFVEPNETLIYEIELLDIKW